MRKNAAWNKELDYEINRIELNIVVYASDEITSLQCCYSTLCDPCIDG